MLGERRVPLSQHPIAADSGRSGRLKPYWGKPDVRNFRGPAGNRAGWRIEAPLTERGGQPSDSPPTPRRLRATRAVGTRSRARRRPPIPHHRVEQGVGGRHRTGSTVGDNTTPREGEGRPLRQVSDGLQGLIRRDWPQGLGTAVFPVSGKT